MLFGEDMRRLNALYEELCWAYDDELVFTHDGKEIIITNKTKEDKNRILIEPLTYVRGFYYLWTNRRVQGIINT